MLVIFACLFVLSSALDVRRATMKTLRKPMKVQLSIPALSSSDDDSPPSDAGGSAVSGGGGGSSTSSAVTAPPTSTRDEAGETTASAPVPPGEESGTESMVTLVPLSPGSPDVKGANATGSAPYSMLPGDHATDVASAATGPTPAPEHPAAAAGGSATVGPMPPSPSSTGTAASAAPSQGAGASDTNLSPQELRDDVDQLIAHVDAEEKTTLAVPPPSAELAATEDGGPGSDVTFGTGLSLPSGGGVSPPVVDSTSGVAVADGASTGSGVAANTTATGEVPRLSIEEEFLAAKARLKMNSVYLGAGELLYMDALSLQATHGDCETASEGGSLFKTDAEVATDDVERGSAQWGAWCVFRGKYKSDAMRQFAAKERVLQDRIVASLMVSSAPAGPADTEDFGDGGVDHGVGGDSGAAEHNATTSLVPGPVAEAPVADGKDGADGASGDTAAAAAAAAGTTSGGVPPKPASTSLFAATATANDTVHPMSAELGAPFASALEVARTLVPDVDDHETRFVSALGLQGLHGDCNGVADGGDRASGGGAGGGVVSVLGPGGVLTPLIDPVLQARVGRADALWGAWCVLGGKARDAAARELIARVDLLAAQKRRLEEEEAAAAAAGGVTAATSGGAAATAGAGEGLDPMSRRGQLGEAGRAAPASEGGDGGGGAAAAPDGAPAGGVERRGVLPAGQGLAPDVNMSVVAAAIAGHMARHPLL